MAGHAALTDWKQAKSAVRHTAARWGPAGVVRSEIFDGVDDARCDVGARQSAQQGCVKMNALASPGSKGTTRASYVRMLCTRCICPDTPCEQDYPSEAVPIHKKKADVVRSVIGWNILATNRLLCAAAVILEQPRAGTSRLRQDSQVRTPFTAAERHSKAALAAGHATLRVAETDCRERARSSGAKTRKSVADGVLHILRRWAGITWLRDWFHNVPSSRIHSQCPMA